MNVLEKIDKVNNEKRKWFEESGHPQIKKLLTEIQKVFSNETDREEYEAMWDTLDWWINNFHQLGGWEDTLRTTKGFDEDEDYKFYFGKEEDE